MQVLRRVLPSRACLRAAGSALLLLLGPGCDSSGTTGPDGLESASVEVSFRDPALETAIRMRIRRAAGPIFASDLDDLEEVDLSSRGISDLSGLEYLTAAQSLSISYNSVSDVTPISGLPRLTVLLLTGNEISSIVPLARLTGLEVLGISKNPIQDFSPLSDLTNLERLAIFDTQGLGEMSWLPALTDLEYLDLWRSPITDLHNLANLTRLKTLLIPGTTISDISPLTSLERLELLHLADNDINDLAPLVANPGLGAGDEVTVWGNPFGPAEACAHIQALRDRGVTVRESIGCG